MDVQTRRELIGHLRTGLAPEADARLWALLDSESDTWNRCQILYALGERPGNLACALQKLRDGSLPDRQERDCLVDGIAAGLRDGPQEGRQAFWNLYDCEPDGATKDGMLKAMLACRDPRATLILVDRLQRGQGLPAVLNYSLDDPDPGIVMENEVVLRVIAADASAPVSNRTNAFLGLYRIDHQGAVDAILWGFDGLSEDERIHVVKGLRMLPGYEEAGTALKRIGKEDPSEAVRKAASALRGW